jgi:hypothetical protein
VKSTLSFVPCQSLYTVLHTARQVSFRPSGARVLLNEVKGLHKATMALSPRNSGGFRTLDHLRGVPSFSQLFSPSSHSFSLSVFSVGLFSRSLQSVRLVSPVSPSSQRVSPSLYQSTSVPFSQYLFSISPSSPPLLFASLSFSPALLSPLNSVRRAALELDGKANHPNTGDG